MKIIFTFFLIIQIVSFNAQTKDELIKKIIDYNVFESDCIGIACAPSEQYNNFKKLKSIISSEELIQLSKHEQPVIRAYTSSELINLNKNPIELFIFEIDKDEKVETQDGCIGDYEALSSIVYNAYRGKITLESISSKDSDDKIRKRKIENALSNDKTLQKLDSIILYSNKDLYWLYYFNILEKKKVSENHIKRILDLAFKQNNSYAFDYILTNYPEKHQLEIRDYFENTFLTANFDSENKVRYLDRFIEYLLATNREDYRQLCIKKLQRDQYWKNHLNWIEDKLKKYNLVF